MAHVNLLKQFKTGTGWVMKSIPRKSNGQSGIGVLCLTGAISLSGAKRENEFVCPPAARSFSALDAQRIKLAEIAATEAVHPLQRYKPL